MKTKDFLLLSLFFLCGHSNSSSALGINEITGKSFLGEPLSVEINISDVEKTPDVSCFSLTELSSPPAFKKPIITIKQQNNDYRLLISTPETITEPILNLQLMHTCEPNFTRTYVLLLDPAYQNTGSADSANAETASYAGNSDKQVTKTSKQSIPLHASTPAAGYSAAGQSNNEKKSKPARRSPSIEDQLTSIYTGDSRTAISSTNQQHNAVKSKPYLTISGGETSSVNTHTLPLPALRFETEIDLSRAQQEIPIITSDVMDEITALDNRLVLLKNQIVNLQQRNEKLKNEAETAQLQLEDTLTKLRIAAGLIALSALLLWIHRKREEARAARANDSWLHDHDGSTDSAYAPISDAQDVRETAFHDALNEKSPYGIATGFGTLAHDTSGVTTANWHENEDILESIDLLVEYGRHGLAIQLLQDYVTNHPDESPEVWLKLASLIAEHGSEAEYVQTCEKCTHYFRIKMPSYTVARKAGAATLEDFPFIIKELESAWGSPAALFLLDDLIYNKESQPEEGFEPEIFNQLFLLRQIAEQRETLSGDIVTSSANHSGESLQANKTENPALLSSSQLAVNTVQTQQPDETSVAELSNQPDHFDLQQPTADETFGTLDFDSYFTQSHDAPAEAAPFITGMGEFHTPEEPDIVPQNQTPFNAPEIDFSQHLSDISHQQEKSAQNPASSSDRPSKKIGKDSNLIDWVTSDDA